jgi:hypothetical protein
MYDIVFCVRWQIFFKFWISWFHVALEITYFIEITPNLHV